MKEIKCLALSKPTALLSHSSRLYLGGSLFILLCQHRIHPAVAFEEDFSTLQSKASSVSSSEVKLIVLPCVDLELGRPWSDLSLSVISLLFLAIGDVSLVSNLSLCLFFFFSFCFICYSFVVVRTRTHPIVLAL